MSFDVWDYVALLGLVLLGAALWLAWGWPVVLAYAGLLMIILGVAGATLRRT